MSQPRYLLLLQDIDTQLDQANHRLKEIEELLSENAELQAATVAAAKTQEALQEAERNLRYAEQEVEVQQGKIDNNQKVLYSGSVKNPKELEDLQNEAAALSRHLSTLEDRQLEKMAAFESAEAADNTAKAKLQAVKNEMARDNSTLGAEQDNLTQKITELSAKRPAAEEIIEAPNLTSYNKIRTKRAGLAVVAVNSKECPACGSGMTAAQAQAARSQSKLTYCDGCGRILVAS